MNISHTQNKLKIHHDEQVQSEQTSVTHVQDDDYQGFTPHNQTVQIERKNSVKNVSKESKKDVKIITQKNNVTKIIEKTSKVTSVFQQSVTSSAEKRLHQAREAKIGVDKFVNKNAARTAKMSRHSVNSEDQSEVLTNYVNADYGIEQTGPDVHIATLQSQNSKKGIGFHRSRHSVDQNPTQTITSEQQSVFGNIQQNGAKDYQVQSAYHLNTRKSAHTTLDNEMEPVKAKNLSIKHVQFSSKSPGSVFKGGDRADNISNGTGFTAQIPMQGCIPDYGVERRTTTAQANGDRRSMKMQLLQAKDGYSSSGLTTMTQNQKIKHRFSHSLDQKTEMSIPNQQYTHGYGFKEKDSSRESAKLQSSKSMTAQLKSINMNDTCQGPIKAQPNMAANLSLNQNLKNSSKLPQVMKVHVVKQQKTKKESQYISLPKQVSKPIAQPVLPQIDSSNNEQYYTTTNVQNESSDNQVTSSSAYQNYSIPFVAEIIIPHKVQGKIRQAEMKQKSSKKQKNLAIQSVHDRARISKQIDNDNIMTKSSHHIMKSQMSKNDTGYRCDSSAQNPDSESARFKMQTPALVQSAQSSADPQNFKVVCRNIREQLDSMVQTMDDMQNENVQQPETQYHSLENEPPQIMVKKPDMANMNMISTTENDGEITMQGDTSRFQSDMVGKIPQMDLTENNGEEEQNHTIRYEEMLKKGNFNKNKIDGSRTKEVSMVSNSSSQGKNLHHDTNNSVQYSKDKKHEIIHEGIEFNIQSSNNMVQRTTTEQVEVVKLPQLDIAKSVMKMSPVSIKKKKIEAELVDRSMQITEQDRTFDKNEFACQTSEMVMDQPKQNLTSTKMPLFNITANVDSEHNNTRKMDAANKQAGSDIFNIQSVKQNSVVGKYSSKELLPPAKISQKKGRMGPVKNLFDKSQPSQSNDLGDVSRDVTAVSHHQRQRTLEQGSSPDSKPRSTTSELYTADAAVLYQSRNQHRPTVQELKKQKIVVQRNRVASQQSSQWLAEDSVFSKSRRPQGQPRGRKHGASFVFGNKKSMHQSYYTSVGHGRQRSLQQSSNASDKYLQNDYESTPPLNAFGKKSRMVKRVRNSVHADQRDPGGQYNLYPGKPMHSRKRDRFYGSLENRPLLLEPSVQVHASRFAESYNRLKGQEQANANRAIDASGRLKGLLYVPGARGSGERRVVQNQYHQQIFDGEINAVNINIQQNNTLDNEFTMGSVSNPNLTGGDQQRVPEIAINAETFKGMHFETSQKLKDKKAVNARTQTRGSAEPNMNLMENFEIQQVRSDGGTHLTGIQTQNPTQRKKASDGEVRQSDFTCAKKKSMTMYEDNTKSSHTKGAPFETVANQLNQVKEETSRNLVSHTRTLSKQSLNHSKNEESEDEHDQALEMVDRIQKEQQKQAELKKSVEESYQQSRKQRGMVTSKLDTNSFKTEVTKKIEFDKAILTDNKHKKAPYGFCAKISPVVPQTTISEKVVNKPSSIHPPKPSTPFIMEVTQTHDALDREHEGMVPKIEVTHDDKSTSIQLMYRNSPHVGTPAVDLSPEASQKKPSSKMASNKGNQKNAKTQVQTNTQTKAQTNMPASKRTHPITNPSSRLYTDPNTAQNTLVVGAIKDESSKPTSLNRQKNLTTNQSQKQNIQQMQAQEAKMKDFSDMKCQRNDDVELSVNDPEDTHQTYYIDIPQKQEQTYLPDCALSYEERNLVQQRQKVMSEKDRIIYELRKLEKVKKKVEHVKVQQHREIIAQEKERLNQEYLELNHLKDLLTIRKQELDELKDMEVQQRAYYSDEQQYQDEQQESQYTYTWRSYSSYEEDAPDQGGKASSKPGEISIQAANLVVPRIMIPQGSGKQQSTTKKDEEGKLTQRVDVFQGLFDWAQSIIMTDLRHQQQKFLVRDKNGQPSKKLFTEGDIYQIHEQFKSKQVKKEDFAVMHKMGVRTMIELMKQLNQPEDVIEEMQQDITEENTFALIKKCSSLLMARSYVYKTLRNLHTFEKLVQEVRNDVENFIELGSQNDTPKQQELHKLLMRKCVGDKSSQEIETNLTMISVQIIQDIAFMRDNFKLFEHMTAVSSKGHQVKNVMAYRRRDAMRYVVKKYHKVKKLVQLIAKESEKKAGNSSVASMHSSVLDISAQMPNLQAK